MPSTLVYAGIAPMFAAALLTVPLDGRALLVVLGADAFPGLDTFIGRWVLAGGHRTVLPNLIVSSILLVVIGWVDTAGRSWLRNRWGNLGFAWHG